eukprot:PhF_6_TR9718/c0_g1_i3/m.14959
MYSYVAPPPEDLLCPKCSQPFIDPVTCPAGGCTLCRGCISTSTCPQCNAQLIVPKESLPPPHRIVRTMLDQLLVRCTATEVSKCGKIFPRGTYEQHVAECDGHKQKTILQPVINSDQCPWCGVHLMASSFALLSHLSGAGGVATCVMSNDSIPESVRVAMKKELENSSSSG